MERFLKEVLGLKNKCKKVYIYGAGLYGQNIYKILKKYNTDVDGFVITLKTDEKEIFGMPIYEAREVVDAEVGLIIGVNRHNAVEIKKSLKVLNFNENNIIWGNEYIDKNGIRGGYDEISTMEITTRIGCKVNCKYCPQNLLIGKYYSENPNRKTMLSIETFIECLNKLPQECSIIFGGMAEPFLNPNCGEMLKIACDSGRKVNIYTTLEGTTEQDIELIAKLPIEFIVLHVADKRNYANISISEEYYKKLSYLINKKREDGTPLINMCNAQTEPDDRVSEICKGKYEILTTMTDRAGNLKEEELYRRSCLSGKISCSMCGNTLNHNILLPDGTVLLCCMDYGMKHILGNLQKQSYEEIMNGEMLEFVKKGLDGDESKNILCRNCSCANACI